MAAPLVITIDGPAGSGKSTLGELLAQQLGYLYFDTGVMYRALTLAVLQARLDLHDSSALEALARSLPIDVQPPTSADGRQYTVLVADDDVTWAIRSPEVTGTVSLVARCPGVRTEMVRQQRIIGQRGRVVMVGRDIGTVVMPDAPLKLYLTASLEERARRRAAEEQARGHPVALEAVQADLARRDELDSHVLQPAADALLLQNDGLDPTDEVAWICTWIATHWPADGPGSAPARAPGNLMG